MREQRRGTKVNEQVWTDIQAIGILCSSLKAIPALTCHPAARTCSRSLGLPERVYEEHLSALPSSCSTQCCTEVSSPWQLAQNPPPLLRMGFTGLVKNAEDLHFPVANPFGCPCSDSPPAPTLWRSRGLSQPHPPKDPARKGCLLTPHNILNISTSHTFQVNPIRLILKNTSGETSVYIKVLGGRGEEVHRPSGFVSKWPEKLSTEYS